MKRFRITVDGTAYEVEVEELDAVSLPPSQPASVPPPAAVRMSAAPPPAPVAPVSAPAAGDVVSPLAGVVVSVAVTVGGQVEAGQPVLVLEAMKMQTAVAAPRSGTVAAIAVGAGSAVQEGQVLITLR